MQTGKAFGRLAQQVSLDLYGAGSRATASGDGPGKYERAEVAPGGAEGFLKKGPQ